jgi:hypothetical protein
MINLSNNFYVIFRVIGAKIELLFFLIDMLLDTAIYTASLFPESWYGMTLIHREFAEYSHTRAGILKYRELFTKVEMEYGVKYIRIFGKLNSIEDKPAVIFANGNKYWYINDKRHRENDQPAVIYANGDKHWHINDKCHRDDDKPVGWARPSVIHANGDKYWYINDKRHRDNDQPAVIYANGDKYWLINSKCHRENDQSTGRVSPAVILANGDKYWYTNGNRNKDQPAIIFAN